MVGQNGPYEKLVSTQDMFKKNVTIVLCSTILSFKKYKAKSDLA